MQITELESLVESQIYNSNNDDKPTNSGVASNARKSEMCGEVGHPLTACPDCERFFLHITSTPSVDRQDLTTVLVRQ